MKYINFEFEEKLNIFGFFFMFGIIYLCYIYLFICIIFKLYKFILLEFLFSGFLIFLMGGGEVGIGDIG